MTDQPQASVAARVIAVGLVEHGRSAEQAPRFIVTRRHADADHLAGAWELPGGKVGQGEAPADALVRELREELGVEIGAPEPLTFSWYRYPERTVLLLFFRAALRADSPEPRALQAAELRLLTRDELLALPFPPANAPLLAALRARDART